MIEIVDHKIDIQAVLESLADPAAGGIDIFIGTTRNHSGGKRVISLEYEAYLPMAIRMMERIAAEAHRRWNVLRISMVHRTGHIDIGEASIVIAVSAAHRHEAFEACRYAIDTLKREVPIWKKELFVDGGSWVGAQES